MSEQRNLDVVRSMYAAFGRGDLKGSSRYSIPRCPGGRRALRTCRRAVCVKGFPRYASSSGS